MRRNPVPGILAKKNRSLSAGCFVDAAAYLWRALLGPLLREFPRFGTGENVKCCLFGIGNAGVGNPFFSRELLCRVVVG